jgi:hypothetical protein
MDKAVDLYFVSTHEFIFCIKTGGIKQWSVYKIQRGAEMFDVLQTPRATEFVSIRKNRSMLCKEKSLWLLESYESHKCKL